MTLNLRIKNTFPKLHTFLKRTLAASKLSVPKMLFGKLVWTHPQLLGATLTEPHVMQWISEFLQPGDVFFDIGAHQGWMSMVGARRTGHIGKVVAFEPTPHLVEFLAFHKRRNRLQQLDIIPKAVSERDGKVAFNVVGTGNNFMNALSATRIEEIPIERKSVIEVDSIALDTFSQSSGLIPRLIKIDTEGAELWICRGAKQLLANHRPTLIVATHPLWLPEGQRIEELFELLKELGYSLSASVIHEYKGSHFGDYLFIAD